MAKLNMNAPDPSALPLKKTRSCCQVYYLPMAGVIFVVGGIALLILSLRPTHHVERQWYSMAKLTTIFVMASFLAIWAFFLSGLSKRIVGVGLLAVAALTFGTIRVDFDGDLNPSLRVRPWLARRLGISHDQALAEQRRWQRDNLPVVKVVLTPQTSDFPGYRGVDRQGIVENAGIRGDWTGATPQQLWKFKVGEGYSSFAVVNGFLFTLEQRWNESTNRDEESLVCYHAQSGRELWVHAWPERFDETMGGPGPRTTPTVAKDGLVYALGARGRLVCVDGVSGAEKWAVDILQGRTNLRWGMSASPLVYDDFVVVNPGPPGALVAYDRFTGEEVWMHGKQQAGYSSPMLVSLAGVPQILLFDGAGLAGCDPLSGKEYWRYPWRTNGNDGINVAQPLLLGGDRVFIASGYGRGGVALKIIKDDPVLEHLAVGLLNGGASVAGRIPQGTTRFSVEQLWTTERTSMRCKFSSPVEYQGYIYGLDDGNLQCIRAEDGAVQWKDTRTPAVGKGAHGHGQLIRCDNHLLILTEFGELALVEATPSAFRELTRVKILDGKKTWNNPSISGGIAYIRNHLEMAAVDLRP